MNNVLYQHGLMGLTTPGEWVRPVDWLPMPATVANSIDILAAVFPSDSNYCAVKISTSSGTYSVDWGDGTTSMGVASNTQADHTYTYSGLSGTDSSLGYRQALIRITPATGSISAVNLNVKHARSGLVAGVTAPWLDVAINAPSATVISMYSAAGTSCVYAERIVIHAMGAVTSLLSAFQFCAGLQKVSFPAGSLQSVTTLASAFYGCYALKKIAFPAGSLQSVTTLASAFYTCQSLIELSFPAGSLALVSSIASAFYACSSAKKISLPDGSMSLLTSCNQAWRYCGAMQYLRLPSTFSVVPGADTSNILGSCQSLSAVDNLSVREAFSVASCKLSGAALNAIFTALPTVTSKTITVTGNHGVPDCTPSIATAKGWTVIT